MNIEKLHNKKIDIFGTKYTIKIVDTLDTETDTEVKRFAGVTYHDNLTIEIARNIGDFKVSNEDMTRTLLHEINHAIFATGQYLLTNDDEPLIEWLARCMYSLIFKQKIFS